MNKVLIATVLACGLLLLESPEASAHEEKGSHYRYADRDRSDAYRRDSHSRDYYSRDRHRGERYDATLPNGLDTDVGERGVTLSGGQKQRVAIARTLLVDPGILILDDSTSSVDTETESRIQEALQVLKQGRTTLVIAQRLSTVKTADLIVVMGDGRVIQQGTHEELLAQPGAYREIYDMQLAGQEL